MTTTDRNAGLDLARAMAIIAVYVSHLCGVFATGWPALALVSLGGSGVELFFSLSGFLIGRLLIQLAEEGVTGAGLRRFWLRRWLRTLPLYFALLTALSAWNGMWNWREFLLVQNFNFLKTPLMLIVAWSLVMEEYFYLFFPLVMRGLAALTRWRGVVLVRNVALLLIGVCVAARLGANLAGVPTSDPAYGLNPLMRLDCAAWGVLAACAWHEQPRWLATLARPWLVPVVTGVIALLQGLFFVLSFNLDFVIATGYNHWHLVYESLKLGVADANFAFLVLALTLQLSRLRGWFGAGTRVVSVLSYAIYLVHVPVGLDFARRLLPPALPPMLEFVVSTVMVAGVALAVHWMIERPFLALRARVAA
jgi:peptidoglycan/LPS O-acetylase OafA/YrhL